MKNDDFAKSESSSERPTQIRRGRIPSFAIYEISEHELKQLEDGSGASLELNFSLVLLSSAISFFVTLLSTQMSEKVSTFLTILAFVFLFVGFYLFFSWYRSDSNVRSLIKSIRGRIPSNEVDPEKEQSN